MNVQRPVRRRAPQHLRDLQDQRGITLIELMVSLLLAAMLSAGIFYMMSGQTRTYNTQMKSLTTQENLWGAMEYLQRQVRMAGYGFGGCQTAPSAVGASATLRGGNNETSTSGYSPLVGLRIYNACSIYAADPQNDYSATGAGNPNAAGACGAGFDAPDSFTITAANPNTPAQGSLAAMRLTKAMIANTDEIEVGAAANFTACSDLVVVWEPGSAKECSLFMVTGISPLSGAAGLQHNTAGCSGSPWTGSAADYNDPPLPAGGYVKGSLAVRLSNARPRHFAVDNTTDPPRLVTWTSDNKVPNKAPINDLEVIADGIEDLQIAWACDVNRDGRFSEGPDLANDEWANNNPGGADTLPACGGQPIGVVRITLVGRNEGGADILNKTGRRPAAEDRPMGTIDSRLRSVLTATVRPRNLR